MNKKILENAEALIRQARLHPNVLQDFKEGILNCSLEPDGILSWETDQQREVIERIEQRGTCKVWHIIKGTYLFNNYKREQVETYLLSVEEIEKMEPWNGGFLAYSYSRFLSAGTADFGDVVIRPVNGGLKRTM